ncbi:MAG: hypothetical protein JNK05_16565 [Myxococcales bacterium]|nr:hypothetical protein [Myxococcales bacterium]
MKAALEPTAQPSRPTRRKSAATGRILAAGALATVVVSGAPLEPSPAFAQSFTARAPVWIQRDVEPRFTLRTPEGFMRQNADGVAYAAFGHPGRRAIFFVYEMGEELQQGAALSTAQLARLREGSIATLDERPARFRVLGFDVPGSIGRGTVREQRIVRFAAPIPARGGTPIVSLLGPEEHERELRQTFEGVLSSARATTHWRTRIQRAVDRVSGWGAVFALASLLAYVLGYYAFWRPARKDDPGPVPSWPRMTLRGTLALSVLATSAWWLSNGDWMLRGMGVLLLLLGAQQALATMALYRTRKES